ncbi:hypothetical protein CS022_08140 [Veronia nyctiphanis]|uniref:Peptidase C39 domain-containing protein n=1 Tax=Veronia nyctiphanis TaxID=1278244 RepID=A0A4Q0YRA1_9GAMM|nr:cysteine peptidase family C39 domain-containing protein [Veronia nyctiphanis]RXJ73700.1 hypothetical protein CS022_08140 [Veronia nyctiphanis]
MSSAKTKVILQSENAECGNACLAMIANKYGIDVSLPQLRKLNPTSIDAGVSIRQISETAQMLGLDTSAVKYDTNQPEELDLPCILHWGATILLCLIRCQKTKLQYSTPDLENAPTLVTNFRRWQQALRWS